MDCSTMPDFPVSHHLPEFAQVHVHCISDAIQSCHPLSPSSPSAFNLSQHQVFSNKSAVFIRWPKYWSFSFSINSPIEYSGLISFYFLFIFLMNFYFLFIIILLLLFYFTLLYWFCHTSTWIRHGCTRVPNPEAPSHLPPPTIPQGHPSTPATSTLYPA